jgi:tRNA G46 methylase TrmB
MHILGVDVGCGKGGFLLALAEQRKEEEKGLDGNADENLDAEAISLKKQKRNYLLDAHVEKNTTANTNTNTNQYDTKNEKRNYLGLEIRSSVAFYARERIPRRDLNGIIDFVGCNANVDLDRLLTSYTNGGGGDIALISVQYPDPHFKKQHQKRRVLTPEFINTMAKFLKPGREVFIQSDIKDVFDTMRLSIREDGSEYFTDDIEDIEEYMEYNPIGVPTERETSVLDQGLPVYRTVFRRKDVKYSE